MTRCWCFSLVVALLAGCAHDPLLPPAKDCIAFGGADYCLQPSMYTFSLTQSVELTHAKGTDKLIVYLEAKNGDLIMVGMTPLGQRVMQARYDANGVSSDLPANAPLNAEYIFAGLQLAAWPLEQARAGVRGTGQLLPVNGDYRRRELRAGDQVVYSATCEGERPVCRRAELRYETLGQVLRIELLEGD